MDAGDFTGDPTVPGKKQTEALIEGMNALGYKVANLSLRELSDGYDVFLDRQKKAQFPFVSANIVWQDTGEPIVAPTTVVRTVLRDGAKVKEVRVGFIGLTRSDPAFLKVGPAKRKIVTVDPLAAAEKNLPSLRQKADVIVALVGMDLEQARQLPKRIKEIDLILGGDSTPGKTAMATRTDDFPEDTQLGRARLMYVGDQGKTLGEVRLTFDGKKAIASQQRSLVQLTREWPDEPKLAALMESVKVSINEFNKAQTLAQSPFAAPVPANAQPGNAQPVNAEPAYTGSDRCAVCHEQAFAVWGKSGHAHAFQTLVTAHQEFNPQCLGCHTIGFNRKGGYQNPQATPNLVNVGCESCHGPSSLHPGPNEAGYGKTEVSSCVTCHTKENSPDFVPAEYIPKVIHWKEAQTRR
ncbi:MAG TPA: multiheme c-type cytochrome [Candidatus Polarisedimenticolia bacterium]|nr:multiheme c-type cytochrome [Candidatus Polarisedimenticolia bacterium]